MSHASLYSSPAGSKGQYRTLLTLMPYLWPVGQWGMRARVFIAFGLMALSKIVNVYVPLFYRDIVDALTVETALAVALPIGLLFAYGGSRVLSVVFAEMREAIFARVAQRAVRNAALRTFRHLHALSLRFHLDRQTGGLSRIIERGVKGIEFVLAFMMFNIIPTLLEIGLVCAILWGLFDVWYALVTFVTIVGYIVFMIVFIFIFFFPFIFLKFLEPFL